MILNCSGNVLNNLYKWTILFCYLRNCKFILILFIGFLLLLSITKKEDGNSVQKRLPDFFKKEDGNSVQKRLPDFFIVGVKKSGTTTLAKFLNYHPSIKTKGESHFFAQDRMYKKGLDFFLSEMPEARDDQVVLSLLGGIFRQYDPVKVLWRLRENIPDAKVILVVKNPIERLVSDIVHFNANHLRWQKPFMDIDKLIMGKDPNGEVPYYPHHGLNTSIYDHVFMLSNFSNVWHQLTAVYSKHQILLLNGDELITSPVKVLKRLENFVEVPTFFNDEQFDFSGRKGYPCFKLVKDGCMGSNKARMHPELKNETVLYLQKHFEPILRTFENQTGMKLKLI